LVDVGKARLVEVGVARGLGRREGHVREKWSVPRQMRQGLAGPGPRYGRAGDDSVR